MTETLDTASRIAYRLTDGGREKMYVYDITGQHRGWLDYNELAQIIAEEIAGRD